MTPVPCIVCDRELKSVIPGDMDTYGQPSEATTFNSHGQYGSTVWDPMRDELQLVINVCDSCLVRKAGTHVSKMIVGPAIPSITVVPWNPEEPR